MILGERDLATEDFGFTVSCRRGLPMVTARPKLISTHLENYHACKESIF